MSLDEKNIAIKVSHVSKDFKLPHDQQNSLKGRLINFRKRGYETQHALKDITFEVKKGDFFGIVGRNGSGKSTLLKMLAGIYTPTSGSIEINGKLTPFIELGVGFNPELSGRDNVFLNGALLGFSRAEMSAMYDEIVEFAELERFMDQKLKNYSSGMQVRLAFSIAIRANTDILVLDEVLAVGDTNFQKKCFEYFNKLKNDKKTIILVTHDMLAVERFCNRAMLINDSRLVSVDKPNKIAKLYNDINREHAVKSSNKHDKKVKDNNNEDTAFTFEELSIIDSKNVSRSIFGPREMMVVDCTLMCRENVSDPSIVFKITSQDGSLIVNSSTRMKGMKLELRKGEKSHIQWHVPNIFNNGVYYVSIQVLDGDRVTVHHEVQDGVRFEVDGWKYPYSPIHADDKIQVDSISTLKSKK